MRSSAEELALLDASERKSILDGYSDAQLELLKWDWRFWGRPEQIWPAGDWFIWMILAGRGWGKTRTATENIAEMLRGATPLKAPPSAPAIMTIIADTPFDMRQYCIEGQSGFLNIGPRDHRPIFEPSKKVLVWPNGCKALLFSAEDPETLRGASGSFFWWDELAKAKYAQAGWDNMMFGMREGNPRGIVTTTPRPLPLLKDLVGRPSTHVTNGSTWDNRANLSEVYFKEVIEPKVGTRLGRQEIEGEILDDFPGALWTRAMLDEARKPELRVPELRRVVVAVDPSGTAGEDGRDDIGIVVAGRGDDGRAYVLADLTCSLSPAGWGRKVVEAYRTHQADLIVAEANFGGAMVESTIRTFDRHVPIKMITSSRGKVIRAEPIAALFEQHKVTMVGTFIELEDEACAFTRDGYLGDRSPNRVDAMVFAISEVMIESPDEEDRGIFKRPWFRLWARDKPLPEFSYVYLSVRTSYDDEKSEKGPNMVALGVYGVFNLNEAFDEATRKRMGIKPEQKYAGLLCDYWQDKIAFGECLERIRSTYREKYGPKGKARRPELVIVEEGGAEGESIRYALSQYGVPSWPFGTEETPTMRGHRGALLVEQGGLYVPESMRDDRRGKPRDWVEPLMRQACSFSGKGSLEYQGGVDQLTAALIHLELRNTLKVSPQRNVYPDPDEKKDKDEAEALEIWKKEQRGKRSYYGE